MEIKLNQKTEQQLNLLAYRDDIAPESLVENLILDYVQYEAYRMFSVLLDYYKDFDFVYGLKDEEIVDLYLKIVNAEEYGNEEE